ncbi:MAG: sulfatase-like hydrolase/transferase [Chlamydiia bacterium]|nr:sulfatase-like hydrolase/transferase [Chlamydiia bacterium]
MGYFDLLTPLIYAIPSLIARFALRKDRSIIGVGQDLFVGVQLATLFFWVSPIIQLLILYDGWVDRKLHYRFDLSCFSLLKRGGEFWDSARAIGCFKIFPLFLAFSLLPLASIQVPLWSPLLGIPLLIIPLSPGKDALLLLWERQLWKKVFGKKGALYPASFGEALLSKNEVCTPLSSRYPLFRMTHGFKGEKAVDLSLKNGEKPPLVFLFIESLRASEVTPEVMPNLYRLKEQGVYFPNYLSNSILTFRAFYTSHFGLPYALEMKTGLDQEVEVLGLPDILKEAGYETNFMTGATWALGNIGPFLKKCGATRVIDKHDLYRTYQAAGRGSWGIDDGYLFEKATHHLKEHTQRPQFLSLLTISSHHPWRVPHDYEGPSFDETPGKDLRNYKKTLHYTDRCLGKFIENLSDDTLLFITGDHGIHLGEEGNAYTFDRDQHLDNFHVPLLIYGKGRGAPQEVSTLGSHCDLLPTVMDLLHLKGFQHSIGKSLLRKEENPRVFFHNPADLKEKMQSREGNKTQEAGEEVPTFFHVLYEKNLLVPPKFRKKRASYSLAPFQPSHKLSGEALKDALKKASPLYTLNLNGHPTVDDDFLQEASALNPSLASLYINQSLRLTDQGLFAVCKNCPALMELDLSYSPLLTEKMLQALPPSLLKLYAKGIEWISDAFFTRPLKELEVLNIEQTPLTEQGLSQFSNLFPRLTELYLSHPLGAIEKIWKGGIAPLSLYKLSLSDCSALSDDEARILFTPHPTLRFLTLRGCDRLTDRLLESLKGVTLHELTIEAMPQLTDRGLQALLSLPLRSLHLKGCVGLSPKAADIIREKGAHLANMTVNT